MTFSSIRIMSLDPIYFPIMYLFLPPFQIQNWRLHLFLPLCAWTHTGQRKSRTGVEEVREQLLEAAPFLPPRGSCNLVSSHDGGYLHPLSHCASLFLPSPAPSCPLCCRPISRLCFIPIKPRFRIWENSSSVVLFYFLNSLVLGSLVVLSRVLSRKNLLFIITVTIQMWDAVFSLLVIILADTICYSAWRITSCKDISFWTISIKLKQKVTSDENIEITKTEKFPRF